MQRLRAEREVSCLSDLEGKPTSEPGFALDNSEAKSAWGPDFTPKPLKLTKTERRRERKVVKGRIWRKGGDSVINIDGLKMQKKRPQPDYSFPCLLSEKNGLLSEDLFMIGISSG